MEKEVTEEKVIKGLKFIAENRDISQEGLVNGLEELGCTFDLNDVNKEYPDETFLYEEGMKEGKIRTGASLIANMTQNEFLRFIFDTSFLQYDDESSVYHFIRKVTNDENYTKENIEKMMQNKKITMEKVVDGLKFIAENRDLPYDELSQGLKELGCDFDISDVRKEIPSNGLSITEGLSSGDLYVGASIIADVNLSEFAKIYCVNRFLYSDDEYSIYHFIRKVTNDKTYTKWNIDNNTRIENRINMDKVIEGLKFIAENRSLPYDELVQGLEELDCDYNIEDVNREFPNINQSLAVGIRNGDLSTGASIIANVLYNEDSRSYIDKRLLNEDDEISIYNFLRKATNDENYTKEYIEGKGRQFHR